MQKLQKVGIKSVQSVYNISVRNKKLKEEMLHMMAWQNEEVEIYYWNATVSLVVEKNNFYSDGQNVTYLMDNDTLAEVFPEMEC